MFNLLVRGPPIQFLGLGADNETTAEDSRRAKMIGGTNNTVATGTDNLKRGCIGIILALHFS